MTVPAGPSGCLSDRQRSDDALARLVNSVLLASEELNLSRVDANVEHGVVYLSGMADDHESKVHAEKEAGAIAGVERVINKIEVDF
ncbi:BON domain-containing protein [Candidatus Nitrospira bockiana]